jgi:hypothetical protein
MNRKEFSKIIAYIATATDKELNRDRLEVYFDLLGDLPFEVMLPAAKKVVLEHPWATFPSAAELRAAAMVVARGKVAEVTPMQAWEMARRFGEKYDPERRGEYFAHGKTWPSQFEALTAKLPPIVVKAIKAFGPLSLSVGKEPIGVLRSQFCETFEGIVKSEERAALLPAPLKESIEQGPRKALPKKVIKALEGIGKPPE